MALKNITYREADDFIAHYAPLAGSDRYDQVVKIRVQQTGDAQCFGYRELWASRHFGLQFEKTLKRKSKNGWSNKTPLKRKSSKKNLGFYATKRRTRSIYFAKRLKSFEPLVSHDDSSEINCTLLTL